MSSCSSSKTSALVDCGQGTMRASAPMFMGFQKLTSGVFLQFLEAQGNCCHPHPLVSLLSLIPYSVSPCPSWAYQQLLLLELQLFHLLAWGQALTWHHLGASGEVLYGMFVDTFRGWYTHTTGDNELWIWPSITRRMHLFWNKLKQK